MSSFNMLMRVTQDNLRDLCHQAIRMEGKTFDGKTYLEYMRSLKPDASGNEWVNFRRGKRFTFEVLVNDFGVSEWWEVGEPIHELCPDALLDKLIAMMGNQDEIMTVWEVHYDQGYIYYGDEDVELELELLGELDGEKLAMIVREVGDG